MSDKNLICVVAYNRIDCLLRLLENLKNLELLNPNTDLIISIDKSKKQEQVFVAISNFEWQYGELKIIKQPANLGLKKHVLTCCDFVSGYKSLTLLEDDLIISPYAFDFIERAVELSNEEQSIAGISLYSYSRNEEDKTNFIPLIDSADNYYIQYPSSWGLSMTPDQWHKFREWLDSHDCDSFDDPNVPRYVCLWPKSSWKKHLIRYLVTKDLYFIYPRFSLTTNPGNNGTHHNNINGLYSVPICTERREWRLNSFKQSVCVYDVNFEIKKDTLKYSLIDDLSNSLGTKVRPDKVETILQGANFKLKEIILLNFCYIKVQFRKLKFKLLKEFNND